MNAKGKYTKENPRAKSVIFRHPNAVDKEDSSGYQCADGVLGCVDAVRDFKTFAVNMINAGLEQKLWDFNEQEEVHLKNTADTWLKSGVMN